MVRSDWHSDRYCQLKIIIESVAVIPPASERSVVQEHVVIPECTDLHFERFFICPENEIPWIDKRRTFGFEVIPDSS